MDIQGKFVSFRSKIWMGCICCKHHRLDGIIWWSFINGAPVQANPAPHPTPPNQAYDRSLSDHTGDSFTTAVLSDILTLQMVEILIFWEGILTVKAKDRVLILTNNPFLHQKYWGGLQDSHWHVLLYIRYDGFWWLAKPTVAWWYPPLAVSNKIGNQQSGFASLFTLNVRTRRQLVR